MILEELFPTVADFRDCVPGISATIEFKELNSSAISAKKQIQMIIPSTLWETVIKEESTSQAKLFLRVALGNLTMHKACIFDILSKRISGTLEVYKHELETMRRQYIDNYFNAMDSLIQIFETVDKYKVEWESTANYHLLSQLKIKTTEEFNSYYNIDMSYLFFFRTLSLQREVLSDMFENYFFRIQGKTDRFETKLKMALVQMIISLALTRFDIIELPATIRNLFDEQKTSRNSSDEQNRLLSIAAQLHQKSLDTLKSIDLALTNPDAGTNIDTDTSFNHPDDKIYLIS